MGNLGASFENTEWPVVEEFEIPDDYANSRFLETWARYAKAEHVKHKFIQAQSSYKIGFKNSDDRDFALEEFIPALEQVENEFDMAILKAASQLAERTGIDIRSETDKALFAEMREAETSNRNTRVEQLFIKFRKIHDPELAAKEAVAEATRVERNVDWILEKYGFDSDEPNQEINRSIDFERGR